MTHGVPSGLLFPCVICQVWVLWVFYTRAVTDNGGNHQHCEIMTEQAGMQERGA